MQPGRTIVLTREHEDNLELSDYFSKRKIRVIEYPCIKTRLLLYHGEKICGGQEIEDFDLIVFSSRRGVFGIEPVYGRIKSSGSTLAAVGKSTAQAVEQRILKKPEIVAPDGTGQGLAREVISSDKRFGNILHVRGTKTTGIFKNMMEKNGYTVCEIIVYENTEPDNTGLQLPESSIVIFASPSAAKFFFKVNPESVNRITCVAIGPTTTKSLYDLGIKNVLTAYTPDNQGIIRAVNSVL